MLDDTDREAIRNVLDFWFDEETKPRWYDSTDAFDALCRQRFAGLLDKAAQDELSDWEQSADGALALCLLLDQMPRNIFRGRPEAFATDSKAVAVAERAITQGFDRSLSDERRKFLYLPFMHSENLAEQERSIDLSKTLEDEETLSYAEDHADVIRRFGRFPHRNAIFGRQSTAEEEAFLKDGAKTYGQAPPEDD